MSHPCLWLVVGSHCLFPGWLTSLTYCRLIWPTTEETSKLLNLCFTARSKKLKTEITSVVIRPRPTHPFVYETQIICDHMSNQSWVLNHNGYWNTVAPYSTGKKELGFKVFLRTQRIKITSFSAGPQSDQSINTTQPVPGLKMQPCKSEEIPVFEQSGENSAEFNELARELSRKRVNRNRKHNTKLLLTTKHKWSER